VGFAAELWDRLARESGLEYDVTVVGTAQEIVDAVHNKTADVGVGALSATAKREAVIDFSKLFYESGMQVLVDSSSASFADNIRDLLKNLCSWQLIGAFVLLIATMVIISHLVWRFEHKINPEMWPQDYRQGDDKLQLVGRVFQKQNYAFAIQQDSRLREQLNRGLLKLSESGVEPELRIEYFGREH